jgi:hypothetical protein
MSPRVAPVAARDFGVPESLPRAGYRSVTPRIVVDDVVAQVRFLREVFAATGDLEPGQRRCGSATPSS